MSLILIYIYHFVVTERLSLCKPFCMYEWQMPTNASKWPSRWWRWTATRWLGSSGSSSRRRWKSGGVHAHKRWCEESQGRTCPRCVTTSLFLHRRLTWGCEGEGYVGDYLCEMGGVSMTFHLHTGLMPPWCSPGRKRGLAWQMDDESSYYHEKNFNT